MNGQATPVNLANRGLATSRERRQYNLSTEICAPETRAAEVRWRRGDRARQHGDHWQVCSGHELSYQAEELAGRERAKEPISAIRPPQQGQISGA